jgi:hypothetical protein
MRNFSPGFNHENHISVHSGMDHLQLMADFEYLNILRTAYWTRENLRLNPKLVLDVGNVLETKGLFIVWSAKI